jgi:hypothetical protein
MDAQLQPLSSPVAIIEGFTTKEDTTLIMHCHDRTFKSVTILSSDNTPLFTVTGKGSSSFSWRRTIKDSTGVALFDLRHGNWGMKNKWTVERPSGRELCSLQHVEYLGKARSALDMTVLNEADGGKEVLVQIKPKDASALSTVVSVGGVSIAEIRLVEENDLTNLKDKDRTVWQGRVAGGVDLTLVSTGVPL